jgi:hypothetical protein
VKAHEDHHLVSHSPIPNNDCPIDDQRSPWPDALVYNGGQVVAADNGCFGHFRGTNSHIKHACMKDSRMDFPGRQRVDVKVATPVLGSSFITSHSGIDQQRTCETGGGPVQHQCRD